MRCEDHDLVWTGPAKQLPDLFFQHVAVNLGAGDQTDPARDNGLAGLERSELRLPVGNGLLEIPIGNDTSVAVGGVKCKIDDQSQPAHQGQDPGGMSLHGSQARHRTNESKRFGSVKPNHADTDMRFAESANSQKVVT